MLLSYYSSSRCRILSDFFQTIGWFYIVQLFDKTSACFSINSIASSDLSGGYLYFCNVLRTNIRNFARTVSRTCQSIMCWRGVGSLSAVAIIEKSAAIKYKTP